MSEFLKTLPRAVYGQLNHKTEATAITSGASVHVVVNQGAYNPGLGTLTHKGNGLWEYVPHTTEADSDSCVVHFIHSDAMADRVMFYATPKRLRDLQDVTLADVAQETNAILSTAHGAGSWEMNVTQAGLVTVNSFSETALLQLTAKGVTIVSPLLKDGTISLVQGDDYLAADGRGLIFTGTSANQWPDLTNATTILQARQHSEYWQVQGEILTATGVQQIRFQLNNQQTSKPAGWWDYQIRVTYPGDRQLTLVQGRLQIIDEIHSPG